MNTLIKSSGILPYAYVPHSNNVYFLFGQEAYDPRWFNSDRWSDFGGCVKLLNKENEQDCAAREFVEESLGVVHLTESHLTDPYDTKTNIESFERVNRMLDEKQYTYRIEYITSNNQAAIPNNSVIRKCRTCYLKRIPWQPHLPQVFNTVRSYLERLNELSSINANVSENQPLQQYWESLPEWLQSHPAIVVTYNALVIATITVNSDWLEKQQIMWWSLPRLHTVLKNNGRYKKDYFRHGFLPILSIILEKFSITATSPLPGISTHQYVVDANPNTQQIAVTNAVLFSNSQNTRWLAPD